MIYSERLVEICMVLYSYNWKIHTFKKTKHGFARENNPRIFKSSKDCMNKKRLIFNPSTTNAYVLNMHIR